MLKLDSLQQFLRQAEQSLWPMLEAAPRGVVSLSGSLWGAQPFVQMRTEAVQYALLIRNVLNAVLYCVCTTAVYFSKPERTQHLPQVVGVLRVCFFYEKAKQTPWFVFYLCGTSCVLVGWDFIWVRIWNQVVWFLFNIKHYFNVTGYRVP